MRDIMLQDLRLWLPVVAFVALWAYMQWHDKMPSVQSIQDFAAVLNSRGGNILVLALGSVYFFKWSMYLFVQLLTMIKDGTIREDNAFALMAIQFVTTTAFGGTAGACLKTMTGESSRARAIDSGNGSSVTVTKSGVDDTGSTTTVKVNPPVKEVKVEPTTTVTDTTVTSDQPAGPTQAGG